MLQGGAVMKLYASTFVTNYTMACSNAIAEMDLFFTQMDTVACVRCNIRDMIILMLIIIWIKTTRKTMIYKIKIPAGVIHTLDKKKNIDNYQWI